QLLGMIIMFSERLIRCCGTLKRYPDANFINETCSTTRLEPKDEAAKHLNPHKSQHMTKTRTGQYNIIPWNPPSPTNQLVNIR
ncbi:unnamed protein product, partial [Dovyalis caffra]